jgi:cbb3-type cytochrome oxidase maturation protein
MESLYLLIPLSIVLVFLIGLIFWWSLKSGQFEDLEGPAYRILMDDDKPEKREAATDPDDTDPDDVRPP